MVIGAILVYIADFPPNRQRMSQRDIKESPFCQQNHNRLTSQYLLHIPSHMGPSHDKKSFYIVPIDGIAQRFVL